MQKFLSKYIGIVLLLATVMGSFHYHNDGKQHTDCQVCTVQSTIFDADIPSENIYLSALQNKVQAIVIPLCSLFSAEFISNVNSRAPPKIS